MEPDGRVRCTLRPGPAPMAMIGVLTGDMDGRRVSLDVVYTTLNAHVYDPGRKLQGYVLRAEWFLRVLRPTAT